MIKMRPLHERFPMFNRIQISTLIILESKLREELKEKPDVRSLFEEFDLGPNKFFTLVTDTVPDKEYPPAKPGQ